MADKKYIIFTDLKDFSYKNSLLTDLQLQEILQEFHTIVLSSAKTRGLKVLKSIGDAFLIFGDEIESVLFFCCDIINLSKQYDSKHKLDIQKISLRITLTYGHIHQDISLDMEDYFGEPINLGARIMDITPIGHIICSQEVVDRIGQLAEFQNIGVFSFYGILKEVQLYAIKNIFLNERTESFPLVDEIHYHMPQHHNSCSIRSHATALLHHQKD